MAEKQYALGIMPMLYFCISLDNIKSYDSTGFIGRKIKSNECGYLEINSRNINVFMQIFRIFSLLSKAHNYDCKEILKYLLKR